MKSSPRLNARFIVICLICLVGVRFDVSAQEEEEENRWDYERFNAWPNFNQRPEAGYNPYNPFFRRPPPPPPPCGPPPPGSPPPPGPRPPGPPPPCPGGPPPPPPPDHRRPPPDHRRPPPPHCGPPPPGSPPPGPYPGPPPGCPGGPPPRHRGPPPPPPCGSQPRGFPPPPHCRGPNARFAPRRPPRNHYRDFGAIFNNIEKAVDAEGYNKTAEAEELNDDFNGRSIVAPGQYPHMAALGFKSSDGEIDYRCGGSLISDSFVLTAAHCLVNHGSPPDVVKIGDIKLKDWNDDVDPQMRRVAQVYKHPLYNNSYHYYDIGLIRLHRPIEFTSFVRPVRLWVGNEIPYEKLHSMGYGSTGFAQAQTNILTELELSVVPLELCNTTMPADESAPYGIIESQVCAQDFEKNTDTCQGDSGGPLQLNLERRRRRRGNKRRYRYYLVGITSYGAFCRSQYPGIYTRVASYSDWIASVVWPNYYSQFNTTNQTVT